MTKIARQDDAYEALAAGISNQRLKQSLDSVKQACDSLEATGVPITTTTVGRYCTDRWNGPKAQSIRNAADTLYAYLQTRRAKQVLPAAARDGAIYEPKIKDETLRAYVALIKTERDEAVRHKDRILKGLRGIPGLPIDELIASGFKSIEKPRDVVRVSAEVRNALARLFAEDKLASVGLELYRQRLRAHSTKQVLLEKPDVEALLALMRTPDKEAAVAAEVPLVSYAGSKS
jgi:hypothetical protein